jgi:hypothetical protein
MDFDTPLPDTEVVRATNSAWQYEATGNNWVGRKARASTDRNEILAMSHDPHAAILLMLLRVSHPPTVEAPFAIDQVKTAEDGVAERSRPVSAPCSRATASSAFTAAGARATHIYITW